MTAAAERLTFTRDELLDSGAYQAPLIAGGVRCHGGFEADGPLPVNSIYDWGFEASLGYFVLRHKVEAYGRTSVVFGSYETPYEGAVGVNWYPFDTSQVWLNFEAIGIKDSPYGGGYYVYSVGQTGFLFQSQFLLRF